MEITKFKVITNPAKKKAKQVKNEKMDDRFIAVWGVERTSEAFGF